MTIKSFTSALCASLLLAVTGTAQADNLVKNGSFEASNTVVTSWGTADGGPAQGFAFVYSPSNNFGGPIAGRDATYGLAGPTNGFNNGLTSSPDGGNFLGQDGNYNLYPLTQVINNLTVGQTYYLSFYWGAAQMRNQGGVTTEGWNVKFGNATASTATISNAENGFNGWLFQSFTFTASSASQLLSFTAFGTGAPPMSLLDGVTLSTAMPVPEPANIALMSAGILGLMAVRRLRSKRD